MNYMIRQPQTIIAQLTISGIGGAVIAAYECKRIGGLYSAHSAVLRVVQKVFHVHLQRIRQYGQDMNRVYRIYFCRTAIAAIVGEIEFIPAQGLATVAFKTCGAHTITAIANAEVQAYHIVALIFITGGINNC